MFIDINRLKEDPRDLETRIEYRLREYMATNEDLQLAIRAAIDEVRKNDFSTGRFNSERFPDLIEEIYVNAYMAGRQDVIAKITNTK